MAETAVEATRTVSYWLPLVTGFVGIVSGVTLEWFRDNRAYKRERDGRDSARKDQQFQRRTDFQRQVLLTLQEEVSNQINCIHHISAQSSVDKDRNGKWARPTVSTDLSERLTSSGTQVDMYCVRASDEAVRKLVALFQGQIGCMVWADTEAKENDAYTESKQIFRSLNERIGEVLRGLDQDEMLS